MTRPTEERPLEEAKTWFTTHPGPVAVPVAEALDIVKAPRGRTARQSSPLHDDEGAAARA